MGDAGAQAGEAAWSQVLKKGSEEHGTPCAAHCRQRAASSDFAAGDFHDENGDLERAP